jgi:hypothetical protein
MSNTDQINGSDFPPAQEMAEIPAQPASSPPSGDEKDAPSAFKLFFINPRGGMVIAERWDLIQGKTTMADHRGVGTNPMTAFFVSYRSEHVHDFLDYLHKPTDMVPNHVLDMVEDYGRSQLQNEAKNKRVWKPKNTEAHAPQHAGAVQNGKRVFPEKLETRQREAAATEDEMIEDLVKILKGTDCKTTKNGDHCYHFKVPKYIDEHIKSMGNEYRARVAFSKKVPVDSLGLRDENGKPARYMSWYLDFSSGALVLHANSKRQHV